MRERSNFRFVNVLVILVFISLEALAGDALVKPATDGDTARGLQPSPTLQVGDIRFGSDKLAHFFSQGWWYYKHWKKNRHSHTPAELQLSMFQLGVKLEHSIQGMKLSGVFSPGDLEANYQGFGITSVCK